MKTYTEIDTIICHVMTDDQFDTIQNDDYDRWSLDRKTAKNGKARLARHLAKHDLTIDEWDLWSAMG